VTRNIFGNLDATAARIGLVASFQRRGVSSIISDGTGIICCHTTVILGLWWWHFLHISAFDVWILNDGLSPDTWGAGRDSVIVCIDSRYSGHGSRGWSHGLHPMCRDHFLILDAILVYNTPARRGHDPLRRRLLIVWLAIYWLRHVVHSNIPRTIGMRDFFVVAGIFWLWPIDDRVGRSAASVRVDWQVLPRIF
jgi:hypothetical protein